MVKTDAEIESNIRRLHKTHDVTVHEEVGRRSGVYLSPDPWDLPPFSCMSSQFAPAFPATCSVEYSKYQLNHCALNKDVSKQFWLFRPDNTDIHSKSASVTFMSPILPFSRSEM